jgi:hypothetical protein
MCYAPRMKRRLDGLIKFLGRIVSFDELVFCLGWVSPFSNGNCPFVFFFFTRKKGKVVRKI